MFTRHFTVVHYQNGFQALTSSFVRIYMREVTEDRNKEKERS